MKVIFPWLKRTRWPLHAWSGPKNTFLVMTGKKQTERSDSLRSAYMDVEAKVSHNKTNFPRPRLRPKNNLNRGGAREKQVKINASRGKQRWPNLAPLQGSPSKINRYLKNKDHKDRMPLLRNFQPPQVYNSHNKTLSHKHLAGFKFLG